VINDQDLGSLFQYPPEPHLAAAAAMPLLDMTIILLRGQQVLLGRPRAIR